MTAFSSLKIVGGLLPADLLGRVSAGDPQVPGTGPQTYGLEPGESVRRQASRSWLYLLSFLHPGFSQVMPWFDRPGLDSFSWFGELFECFSNTAVAAVPRLRTGNDPGGHAARTAANGSCSI